MTRKPRRIRTSSSAHSSDFIPSTTGSSSASSDSGRCQCDAQTPEDAPWAFQLPARRLIHSTTQLLRIFSAVKQLVIGAIIACACGCGGGSGLDMATVSGVVTLDGQPLEGAIVTFVPQDATTPNSGSMSIGITDAQGHVSTGLRTPPGWSGLSALPIGREDSRENPSSRQADDNSPSTLTVTETADRHFELKRVPEKWSSPNRRPTISSRRAGNPDMLKEVQAGKNMIDFDLKGDGKIIQLPKSEEG